MKKPETETLKDVVLESGITVKPVFGPEDIEDIGFEEKIGKPGEYPFTRGIHPFMYRRRPWTMRQYSGFGTARETNERFKWLLGQGQTALNVGVQLAESGVLEKHGVEVLGTPVDAIKNTEDRDLFIRKLTEIRLKVPRSVAVSSVKQALEAARRAGADTPRVIVEEKADGLDAYTIVAKAMGNPRLMK